jgi:hypothetical protein
MSKLTVPKVKKLLINLPLTAPPLPFGSSPKVLGIKACTYVMHIEFLSTTPVNNTKIAQTNTQRTKKNTKIAKNIGK